MARGGVCTSREGKANTHFTPKQPRRSPPRRLRGARLRAFDSLPPSPPRLRARAHRAPESRPAGGLPRADPARPHLAGAGRAPRLPERADEAVDGALRVQGHDVPYVEETGHFLRHAAASCSTVDLRALPAPSPRPPRSRGRRGAAASARAAGLGTPQKPRPPPPAGFLFPPKFSR